MTTASAGRFAACAVTRTSGALLAGRSVERRRLDGQPSGSASPRDDGDGEAAARHVADSMIAPGASRAAVRRRRTRATSGRRRPQPPRSRRRRRCLCRPRRATHRPAGRSLTSRLAQIGRGEARPRLGEQRGGAGGGRRGDARARSRTRTRARRRRASPGRRSRSRLPGRRRRADEPPVNVSPRDEKLATRPAPAFARVVGGPAERDLDQAAGRRDGREHRGGGIPTTGTPSRRRARASPEGALAAERAPRRRRPRQPSAAAARIARRRDLHRGAPATTALPCDGEASRRAPGRARARAASVCVPGDRRAEQRQPARRRSTSRPWRSTTCTGPPRSTRRSRSPRRRAPTASRRGRRSSRRAGPAAPSFPAGATTRVSSASAPATAWASGLSRERRERLGDAEQRDARRVVRVAVAVRVDRPVEPGDQLVAARVDGVAAARPSGCQPAIRIGNDRRAGSHAVHARAGRPSRRGGRRARFRGARRSGGSAGSAGRRRCRRRRRRRSPGRRGRRGTDGAVDAGVEERDREAGAVEPGQLDAGARRRPARAVASRSPPGRRRAPG